MSPIPSLGRARSLRLPAATVALLVAFVLVGEWVLRTAFADIGVGAGLPAWLPRLGSVGQTVTYYSLFLQFVTFVALPVALLWLAYAYGRQQRGGRAE